MARLGYDDKDEQINYRLAHDGCTGAAAPDKPSPGGKVDSKTTVTAALKTEEERRNASKLAGSYGKQRRFDTLEHLFLVHSVANCIAIPLPTSLRSATFPSGEGMAAYAAKR